VCVPASTCQHLCVPASTCQHLRAPGGGRAARGAADIKTPCVYPRAPRTHMLQFQGPAADAAPVGRTGIYLDSHGKTAERPPGGDWTTVVTTRFDNAPLWSVGVLDAHFAAHPDALFSQGKLPHWFLRTNVELLRLIGQGSHGAAFDCRLRRLPLSIKGDPSPPPCPSTPLVLPARKGDPSPPPCPSTPLVLPARKGDPSPPPCALPGL
jgi:hypothetical protein